MRLRAAACGCARDIESIFTEFIRIDLGGEAMVGKDIFAAFLAAAAQGKPFFFGIPNEYAAGAVTQGGQW